MAKETNGIRAYLYSPKEVRSSKDKALEVITSLLRSGDVDTRYTGGADSHGEFLVTWRGNWNRVPQEYSVRLTNSFYMSYSGARCIYARAGLFNQKQLDSFRTVEEGLIKVGMKLCRTKKDTMNFFNEFAVPYNNKIKANKPKQ